MKTLMMMATAAIILVFTSMATAAETGCKGDAARSTPPVPNNPTHLWNVIWRNQRAMCLQQSSEQTSKPHPAGIPSDESNKSNTPPETNH